MTVVKGTKQYPVKVVEDRPLLRAVYLILIVFIVAVTVWLSHERGYATGMAGQEEALDEVARLSVALDTQNKELTDLQQRVANVNLGAEIDRKASEEIRQEVIALKEQIADLEEENSFYRGLMAPTENKRGLTFGSVELSETDQPRTYNYKVVLQQLATNHQLLNGTLEYRVVGRANGIDASYNLSELSDQVNSQDIKLRFKYFQTVEGQLQLPEAFEPIAIELVAKSVGRNSVTVEKRFGWLVEEVL